MNNFFENHIEEINLISNRSKKESRTTISRLQKATLFCLSAVNKKITANNIKSLEGINIHQHTDEGHAIIASSDRMYLPDVATRLYQGLDNILTAYKSHKVHKDAPRPKYFEESVTYIENLDISEWDSDYFIKTLSEFYDSFDDNFKKTFDLHFDLEGRYAFWTMFNTDGKNVEFDEFSLVLTYGIALKGESEILMNGTKTIVPSEVRSRNIDLDSVKDNLNFYSQIVLKGMKTVDAEKISPDLVYADSNAAGEIVLNLVNADRNLGFKYQKNCDEPHLHEYFDKFGNKITDHEAEYLRQTFFNSKTTRNIRNVKIDCTEEGADSILDLDNLVQYLRNKTKKQKFLLLLGTKSHCQDDCNHSENVFEPGLKIYFDGNDFSFVDFDFVDYTNLDKIDIEKSNCAKVVEHPASKSKISISGLAHALFSLSEKVKLI